MDDLGKKLNELNAFGLTAQQARFAQYVVEHPNEPPKNALTFAEYNQCDASMAKRIKNVPQVKAYIQHLRLMATRSTVYNVASVLDELIKLASYNSADYFHDVNGTPVLNDWDTMTRDQKACIKSVKVKVTKDGTETEYTYFDKLKALETLGKHYGMFIERHMIESRVEHVMASPETEALMQSILDEFAERAIKNNNKVIDAEFEFERNEDETGSEAGRETAGDSESTGRSDGLPDAQG